MAQAQLGNTGTNAAASNTVGVTSAQNIDNNLFAIINPTNATVDVRVTASVAGVTAAEPTPTAAEFADIDGYLTEEDYGSSFFTSAAANDNIVTAKVEAGGTVYFTVGSTVTANLQIPIGGIQAVHGTSSEVNKRVFMSRIDN